MSRARTDAAGPLVSGPRMTCSTRGGKGVAGGGCSRSGAEDVSSPAVDPTRRGRGADARGGARALSRRRHTNAARWSRGTITLERRTPAVAISIRGDVHADEKVTPPCEGQRPFLPNKYHTPLATGRFAEVRNPDRRAPGENHAFIEP